MDKDVIPQAPKNTEARDANRDADRKAHFFWRWGRTTRGFRVGSKTGCETNARGFSDVQLKERIVPVWVREHIVATARSAAACRRLAAVPMQGWSGVRILPAYTCV